MKFFQSGKLQKLKDYAYFLKEKSAGFPKRYLFFQKMNGYSLDLNNPLTHNQRIIHKMITDRNPLLTLTADKVKVREYLLDKLGKKRTEEILIPLHHISKTGKDIPMPAEGQEFFMKANHASGFNRLLKPGDNQAEIQSLAKYWLSRSFGQIRHEWAYRDIPRRIICEKVIRDERGKIPMDINGALAYCYFVATKLVFYLSGFSNKECLKT